MALLTYRISAGLWTLLNLRAVRSKLLFPAKPGLQPPFTAGACGLSSQSSRSTLCSAASALYLRRCRRAGLHCNGTVSAVLMLRPERRQRTTVLVKLDSATTLQEQFQIQFWKTRQAEYEPYLLQYSPIRVRQVDLPSSPSMPTITHSANAAGSIDREHDVAADGEHYYRVI